jgi:hypothetical protein
MFLHGLSVSAGIEYKIRNLFFISKRDEKKEKEKHNQKMRMRRKLNYFFLSI